MAVGRTGEENRRDDYENFVKWISGDDSPAGTVGERRSEVANRAHAALVDAIADQPKTVVLVTHGGTARCLLGKLLALDLSDWAALGGLSNACWSVLEYSHVLERWTLIEHNAGSIPEPVFGNEPSN
jgi:probable phosphoglycerate mutase